MEISSLTVLPEMGFEDPCFMNQWQISSSDELGVLPMAAVIDGHISNYFSQPSINFQASIDYNNRPSKLLKPNTWGSCKVDPFPALQHVDSSNVFSAVSSNFTNQNFVMKPKEEKTVSSKNMGGLRAGTTASHASFGNQNYAIKASSQGSKRVSSCNRLPQTQDHIMAERKRREKLSEHFIALSALVPGLKKMDKASVLGDTIKYVKQLQEKVKTLEEVTRKKTTESVVFIKRCHLCIDDKKSCLTGEKSLNEPVDEPLPEIEARISDQDVLIKIHCEKRKGTMEKIISEIEKLHLTITNTSSMAFGNFTVDITIIAQMDPEFGLLIKDLVRKVRSALNPMV